MNDSNFSGMVNDLSIIKFKNFIENYSNISEEEFSSLFNLNLKFVNKCTFEYKNLLFNRLEVT
jgi:hypothetical protein